MSRDTKDDIAIRWERARTRLRTAIISGDAWGLRGVKYEQAYAQAYRDMVRAELAPRLKKKYQP